MVALGFLILAPVLLGAMIYGSTRILSQKDDLKSSNDSQLVNTTSRIFTSVFLPVPASSTIVTAEASPTTVVIVDTVYDHDDDHRQKPTSPAPRPSGGKLDPKQSDDGVKNTVEHRKDEGEDTIHSSTNLASATSDSPAPSTTSTVLEDPADHTTAPLSSTPVTKPIDGLPQVLTPEGKSKPHDSEDEDDGDDEEEEEEEDDEEYDDDWEDAGEDDVQGDRNHVGK
ncbi:hypothetical protein B0O80DRAFT_10243 [Mortierella sp. GBAus27b]|nr:hypothetical protein B0O80DRAFT_10243 [Mortierella sp. GBAus27b]